jgi:hypothetical protein
MEGMKCDSVAFLKNVLFVFLLQTLANSAAILKGPERLLVMSILQRLRWGSLHTQLW